jgi:hypothetical protein
MGQYQRKIRRLVGAYYWAFDCLTVDFELQRSLGVRIYEI